MEFLVLGVPWYDPLRQVGPPPKSAAGSASDTNIRTILYYKVYMYGFENIPLED